MLEAIKLALRIKTDAYNSEIADLIASCKADLHLCGVLNIKIIDADPLIQRAATLYCKANFGTDKGNEKFAEAYEALKRAISLCTDYTEVISGV